VPSTHASTCKNTDQGLNTSYLFPTTVSGDAQSRNSFFVSSDLRTSLPQPQESSKNHPGYGIHPKTETLTRDISIISPLSSSCTESDTWASRAASFRMQSEHSSPSGFIKSTAVTNSAAVQHSPQSFQGKGDKRFSPNRPPSQESPIIAEAALPFEWSPVNLSAKLNRWARPTAPRCEPEQAREDSAGQSQVSPPASTSLLRPRSSQTPPVGSSMTGTPAQRGSLFDPDYEVHSIADIELTNLRLANISTLPRYLSNGEANRRGMLTHPPSEKKTLLQEALQNPPRADVLSLWGAAAPTQTPTHGRRAVPPPLSLHITVGSGLVQPPERESTPHPCVSVPRPTVCYSADQIHAESYTAAAAQRISPAASIKAFRQNAPQTHVKTPKDVKYLDLVLAGRLEPDGNREEWVAGMIERLTLQAVQQDLRRFSDNHRPLPCIEDVTIVQEDSVNCAGHEGRKALSECNGELLKDGGVQVSSDGEQDQEMLWSTQMTAGREECVLGQVAAPAVKEAEQTIKPAHDLAGHDSSAPPNSHKTRRGKRNASPPLPLAEGGGGG